MPESEIVAEVPMETRLSQAYQLMERMDKENNELQLLV